MHFEIRVPCDNDAEAFHHLGWEAFGWPSQAAGHHGEIAGPGRTPIAATDADVPVARVVETDYDSWFGGRLVPTSGIGGVTVAMEYRGRKLLAPLFAEALRLARERGAVISTLYPSAPGIYRRMGYEIIGSADLVEVSLAPLARLDVPAEVTLRRATLKDIPGVRGIYDAWAAAQNGPLSRRGASFPEEDGEVLAAFNGITLAEVEGRAVGYASWNRGPGGPGARLDVFDLIASTAAGYRALLAGLGTFSPVASHASIATSGLDLLRAFLPASDWSTIQTQPYMLKIIDVAGAMEARGYPRSSEFSTEFGVKGDWITANDGRYRLEISDGRASCYRLSDLNSDPSLPVFTANGLALAYAGTQSLAGIRMVGGLAGSSTFDDEIGSLFAGRPVRIRDTF